MSRVIVSVILWALSFPLFAWGATGHRVIGLIAERHLTNKAKKNVSVILQHETIAEVSTYMDFIRSDTAYRYLSPWHYTTIPDGKTYQEIGPPPEGDVIQAIEKLIKELKNKDFSVKDEAFALKCLIHLVGDVHQPLHVGNGTDRGGNDVEAVFFWQESNLHRVWDSGIIDTQKYSYTEYANWIDHATPQQKEAWTSTTLMTWAEESVQCRAQCYATMPSDSELSYRYVYENIDLVNQRLLQAGLRLAMLLNEIYG